MIQSLFHRLFGTTHERYIRKLQPKITAINAYEDILKKLSDEELQGKTETFKNQLNQGKTLDDILPEAFAVAREASKRTLNMRHFDVQLIGGIALHEGKIAEMKTGEGKTLVATLAAYLNALSGKSVHIVTVNDYLARRDATEMGKLFAFLGLTTSFIVHGQNPDERKKCYEADIIYATNNELGFDYLRDNLATDISNIVQFERAFAIVDEVDSILIDEARTPLIISSPSDEATEKYVKYSKLIPFLELNTHYTLDEKSKSALITNDGVEKMESLLGMQDLYSEEGFQEVHHIEQALKAYALFKRDIDYVVQNGEIIIVDEFTGRLMPGRRYSDGLHQAIEAKEAVEVKQESKTLASITFQNFFRLYDKLAGMTGTAETEAEEFYQIYELETIVIPPNKPVKRDDKSDLIYKNKQAKYNAITQMVKEMYYRGQPVLIGTVSIDISETLSRLFHKENIPHQVLNAKQHDKEAEIIADAGKVGSVTIATNMAGRGTDIKLGEGARELGGLAIIGSERHESRRIDNQLRGRSGRQGDPGESCFFVSMEDDLMRLFGGERIQNMMTALNVPEDMPIHNGIITKSIESAQRKIEGYHFDTRKHILEYDDVLSKQREKIYAKRRALLEGEDISQDIKELFEKEAKLLVAKSIDAETSEYDLEKLENLLSRITNTSHNFKSSLREDLEEEITAIFETTYNKQKTSLDNNDAFSNVERAVYLRTIDSYWMEHIDHMTNLRSDVSLYGYGQRHPLVEYKRASFESYVQLMQNIQSHTLGTLFHLNFNENIQIQGAEKKVLNTNEADIEKNLESKIIPKQNTASADKKPLQQRHDEKIDRNSPCPCGSGKKYKKCHGLNA